MGSRGGCAGGGYRQRCADRRPLQLGNGYPGYPDHRKNRQGRGYQCHFRWRHMDSQQPLCPGLRCRGLGGGRQKVSDGHSVRRGCARGDDRHLYREGAGNAALPGRSNRRGLRITGALPRLLHQLRGRPGGSSLPGTKAHCHVRVGGRLEKYPLDPSHDAHVQPHSFYPGRSPHHHDPGAGMEVPAH